MLYIHAHNSRHNLINHYDYAVNSYSCSLWNHLLDPVIPFGSRTPHQDILYDNFERMLLWDSAKDFANFPWILHTFDSSVFQSGRDMTVAREPGDEPLGWRNKQHDFPFEDTLVNRNFNWNYEDYTSLILDTRKPVYAVHPFSSTIPDDYESVCADFGYSLERVVHPWNSLTTEALWAVAAEFNWCAYRDDGFESSIARDSNDWYAKLFSKDYTLAEWKAIQAPKL